MPLSVAFINVIFNYYKDSIRTKSTSKTIRSSVASSFIELYMV